jgi:hypothetical protein
LVRDVGGRPGVIGPSADVDSTSVSRNVTVPDGKSATPNPHSTGCVTK